MLERSGPLLAQPGAELPEIITQIEAALVQAGLGTVDAGSANNANSLVTGRNLCAVPALIKKENMLAAKQSKPGHGGGVGPQGNRI